MIERYELSSFTDFEATYKSNPKINEKTRYERVISTEYKDDMKYFYIECFEKNNLQKTTKKIIIAIDRREIKALDIEIYDNGIPKKYGEFKFEKERILFRKYNVIKKKSDEKTNSKQIDEIEKELIEDKRIDLATDYITILDAMSYRNILTNEFPTTGIKRIDGFFIITENKDIIYKHTNCELYFDGEEEVEIDLGSFVCTKRRILYTLDDKLTMETFYNDFEDILITVTKILESPTGTNEMITYEIIERTENVIELPEIVIFNDSITEKSGLDKIKLGKHSYYNENDKIIGIEKWLRNESNNNNNYRIHTLYNIKEKTVMNIKLKQEINSLNKYSEIKIYEEFIPLIKHNGEAKFWFQNNRVYSHVSSDRMENRLSSYSSEGYYVFYPMAGMTDLIITRREFPLFTYVKSYSVRFYNSNSKILKPKVITQELKYDCDEYIEVIGKKFYAMKLIVKDENTTNLLWFDKNNLLNLRWYIIDNINDKLLLKSELSEYNA